MTDRLTNTFIEYLRKDIDLLEKVRKLATRLIINDRGLTYGERLTRLGLTTLETRRLRGDLIEVFKIFKGFDDVKPTDFLANVNVTLRLLYAIADPSVCRLAVVCNVGAPD